jgi:hypothetical protein
MVIGRRTGHFWCILGWKTSGSARLCIVWAESAIRRDGSGAAGFEDAAERNGLRRAFESGRNVLYELAASGFLLHSSVPTVRVRDPSAGRGDEDESKSLPLALQQLFAAMQLGSRSCATNQFAQTYDTDFNRFAQHDVQEFCRKFL